MSEYQDFYETLVPSDDTPSWLSPRDSPATNRSSVLVKLKHNFRLKAPQLIKLIGPVNRVYRQQAMLLLRKHHLNETYARNIFFRELYLKNINNKHFNLYKDVYKTYDRKKSKAPKISLEQTSNCKDDHNNSMNVYKKCTICPLPPPSEEVLNNNDLLIRICSFVPTIGDIYNFGGSSKFLSIEVLSGTSSSSHIIWKNIAYLHFHVAVNSNDNAPGINWKEVLKTTVAMRSSFSCPKCNVFHSIIPVLYGYPHKDLIKAMTDKQIILGGDHIFPNSRIWQCINVDCKTAFHAYPYNDTVETLRNAIVPPTSPR